MRQGPLRILLDTNVLLDEYLPMRPEADVSRELIDAAVHAGHELLYPARAIVDVHYMIAKTYKDQVRQERGTVSQADALCIQKIAWGCIDNLCDRMTAVGLDQSDVWLARKYRSFNSDFEDNFVLAAAERAQADFLVTSNKQLLTKATVAALSPANMLALLNVNQPFLKKG